MRLSPGALKRMASNLLSAGMAMAGTTAAPSPAATKARTPSISPPWLTRRGSTPALRHAAECDLAQVVPLAEHDERQAVELGHRDAAAGGGGQWMIGCHGQDQRIVEERRGGHQRVVDRQHHQGEINLATGQLAHELARARFHHQQLDPRVAGVELDQGRGQHPCDQAGSGPDGQPAAGHAAERTCLGARGLHIGQDAADEREKRLAVCRECHETLPGPAVKQQDAELAFEQAYLSAQRRLGEMQPLRCLREVALLGDRDDVAELVQLHLASLRGLHSFWLSISC